MSEEEETPSFELGDRILLLGGRFDQTRGRIYYLDDTLMRILPDGASDRLIDIPIIDGDLDPALELDHLYLLQKRATPAFVSQIDLHVDQNAETFSTIGEPGEVFRVKEVDEEEDRAVFEDSEGTTREISFAFRGIPQEESFAVLRPRAPPAPVKEAAPEEAVEEAPEEEEFQILEELGVEEEAVAEIREIPVTQRYYPDLVQRNVMLQDLILALSPQAQKNPKQQRDVRKLVEMFLLLRNEITKYSAHGEPIGSIPTSYLTVAELIDQGQIPLSRPVVGVKRIMSETHTVGHAENPDPTSQPPDVQLELQYQFDHLNEANEYQKTQIGGVQSAPLSADALPNWFITWETQFQKFARSWLKNGDAAQLTPFVKDRDFLVSPVSSDPTVKDVDGLQVNVEGNDALTSFSPTKVHTVTLRGLGSRRTRIGNAFPNAKIESAEEGAVETTLLFPLSMEPYLGATRTGSVARDIAFAKQPPKTMRQILELLNGIPDVATAGSILSLGEGGNTSGNIPLEDWLQAQPLQAHGFGDILPRLQSLGLSQKEFTLDQHNVLVQKIQQYRALLKQTIAELRENSKEALASLRVEAKPFLQGEALKSFLGRLFSEAILAQQIQELQGRIPAQKDSDLALVAGLHTQFSDLLLATLGGSSIPLAKERNRAVRDQFLQAMKEALLKVQKRAEAGKAPLPNKCPHVQSLVAIRKVSDDEDRMRLLAKFLAQFRGSREDNWIHCSACKQHLLCYHEVLQLQEYLHPREKEALHKELLLTFSGGQFHGSYMCKNCGQSISELEFDNHMEQDDEGRPMNGRAVLVDEDAVKEEELNLALGIEVGTPEEIQFKNETQTLIYKTARQIFDRVGIFPEAESQMRIVERVESEILKQPSRDDQAKIQKASKAKMLDQDILINRVLVASTAAHLLIEVQTHVPGQVLRYRIPGCVAGFGGYPMDSEADMTGINQVSCAISSIKKNEAPWNLTGFQRESSDKKRQDAIAMFVAKLVKVAAQDASVQQRMAEKKAQLQKTQGSESLSDRLPEHVPNGFKPTPQALTAEEIAAEPIIAEAASPAEAVRAWIQQGHKIATQTTDAIKGSPQAESTCCFTPIQEARGFWNSKEITRTLPALPAASAPRGPVGGRLATPFKPRRRQALLSDLPDELLQRVFLKVCQDGPRKGLPHEPGQTHICESCGFQFPENPQGVNPSAPFQKDLLKEWDLEMGSMIEKGRIALETQGIEVDRDTFQDILDHTHRAQKIEPPVRKVPLAGVALLETFAALSPPPTENWGALLQETIQRVSTLPPGAEEIEIASAQGPLSNQAAQSIETLRTRLGGKNISVLERVFNQSTPKIVEMIRTQVLIPCQRAQVGVHSNTQEGLQKQQLSKQDVSSDTVQDILKLLEGQNKTFCGQLTKRMTGFARVKAGYMIQQLSAALDRIQKQLRAPQIPGGALGLPQLVQSILVGIFAEFIDPNIVPVGISVGVESNLDTSARSPLQILESCFTQIETEAIDQTEDRIREIIARRSELEKVGIISKIDRMSPEEKAINKLNQRLGLGDWAVGGTKAIYRQDPEQQERERQQRLEMGFDDGLGGSRAALAEAQGETAQGGQDVDAMGEEDQ